MLRGLHHTVISTPDLGRALHFYRDLLGLEVVTRGTWEAGWKSADTITNLDGTAADMAIDTAKAIDALTSGDTLFATGYTSDYSTASAQALIVLASDSRCFSE